MQWKLMYVWNLGKNLKSAAGAEKAQKAQKEWMVFVNLYFLELFLHFFFNFTYLVTRLGLCNRWLDFAQTVNMFYVSTKVNMNKFETNELMSNWTNELEICWNKLKCNFFKNHSHLDSKRQKSSTHTTLFFYHFYVSTKVNMNKFETNELMSNWTNELEICWNKLKCNFFQKSFSSWF